MWLAVVALLIVLLLMMAPSFIKGWWNDMVSLFSVPSTSQNASTVPQTDVNERSTTTSGNSQQATEKSTTTTTNNTTTTGDTSSDTSLIRELANNATNGTTKDQVLALAPDIEPVCTDVTLLIIVRQVCTFTQDGKVVTITFQDGQVVNKVTAGF